MKPLRFNIRTIFLVITCIAIFCAGYLVGFRNGRDTRYDDLITLIRHTIVPSHWTTNESIENVDGGCPISVSNEFAIQDPFNSATNAQSINDPFSSGDDEKSLEDLTIPP